MRSPIAHENQAKLEVLVAIDLETFTLDLRSVSDYGDAWVYPPPVDSFPAIPRPQWLRLSGYIALGGLTNADVQHLRLTSTLAAGAGGGECR
ncbi:MAG: hypothetical protein ABJF07_08770 [Nisaea sp.]|uniref:hypothetical protein n=1 Tax=Nisaea sp. TaxID=2024842 RepID=UPI0032663A56